MVLLAARRAISAALWVVLGLLAACGGGAPIPGTPARWSGEYEGAVRVRFFDGVQVQSLEQARGAFRLSGVDVVGETRLTLQQGRALQVELLHTPEGELRLVTCCEWNVLELEQQPRFLFNLLGGGCETFPCERLEPRFSVGQLDDSGLRLVLHGVGYRLEGIPRDVPRIPEPGTRGTLVEGNFELSLELRRR